LAESSENDRKVIETLGATLAGSDRPLLLTSGTGLVRSKGDRPAMESDEHLTVAEFRRAATEDAADALIAAGRRVVVVRLPQVHDTEKQGRLSIHVQLARKHGRVAYVGDGAQGLPAAHVSDVARLYRLALEDGRAGARWHAVAEESVSMKKIAEAIGKRLNLPAVSIDEDEAKAYFGPLAMLAAKDLAASGFFTQRELAWKPTGPDLLTDLQHLEGSPA
ncbi:MAG TPA: 3-beta hydroxysteroid dehydrogenase, partial [Polyangiaceae bacterium]